MTTVISRSTGSSSTRRMVVVPASMAIVPSSGQLSECGLGDALLLSHQDALTDRDRGLEPQPLDRNRAAVDAADPSLALEDGEVATHGLGRDAELVGDPRDVHPTVPAGGREDQLLALCGVHADHWRPKTHRCQ